MKQELGWYFPTGERHLPAWMRTAKQMRDGIHQYQLTKYVAAMKFVRASRQGAIDVGGHIGQWSRNMAKDFDSVQAFEPVANYAECWRKNMEGVANATLHPVALGEAPGVVCLKCGTPGSHGDTFIASKEQANAEVDVEMRTLDSFQFKNIDFVKIDCEGYELFVIKGGETTIRRDKPCIIVEQKPGKAQAYGFGETEAVALIKSWGAEQRAVMAGDYILSWD